MVKLLKRTLKDISSLKSHPALAGVSDTTLNILAIREFKTPEEIQKHLFSGISDFHDPRLMKDAVKGSSIIEEAIRNGDQINVYGDYDADGVGSTSVMTMLIRKAGGKVTFFTNNRFIHGYGICPKGVDDMLALYPNTKLIVTVDNGISAHAGIQYAKEKGLTVVVTDHHDPAETLPNADAIINPKRKDCTYPFKGLCGAGVAFKLMLLMYWNMGLDLDTVYETMDIVALSTVADVVPLLDENRILVKEGLRMIEQEKRSVFSIFRKITEVKTINAHNTIGMIYAPMINAIGRLDGDPKRAIDMFFEEDETRIEETILYLKEVNERRKAMTVEQTDIAMEMIEGVLDEETGIRTGGKGLRYINVVYHPDFHEGIVGLIAGRLKEKYNRPVYVFTKEHGFIKGSGRGIDGFHLKEAMDKIKHLLKGYGGHAKACGLSLEEQHLVEFEAEMNKIAEEELTEEAFIKVKRVELSLRPKDFTVDIIDELKELEPFGEGFPKPIIGVEGFVAEEVFPVEKGSAQKTHYMTMGSEKQHLKLKCGSLDLIAWGMAEQYVEMGKPTRIKAIGFPGINVWQDRVNVQFLVEEELLLPAS